MKILFTTVFIGFLFISASAFTSDYAQTQNRVGNRDKEPKPIPSQADQMQNLESSDQRSTRPERNRPDYDSSGSVSRPNSQGQSQFEKDTGISNANIPGREK